MSKLKILTHSTLILFTLLIIGGCSAPHTVIKKRNLIVQTQMSETVFLEPVAPSKRIVFINIRNTTDKELPIERLIHERIIANGFTVTDDPEQAYYMLQANILQIERSDLRSTASMLEAGFGGAMLGSTLSQMDSHSSYRAARRDEAKDMLIGATVAIIADALVDDILYTMVTDLRVRERPQKSETVTQVEKSSLSQGSSTDVKQRITGGSGNWKSYQTRIVSTANQVNLEFEEARDALMEGLVRSIGGIF
ncbi:MAG: complement resistance protein TraT [Gammaproteobacteria bacterium]|nr:complement resistance protein TraT [Gammaproteobacteria bacterium]